MRYDYMFKFMANQKNTLNFTDYFLGIGIANYAHMDNLYNPIRDILGLLEVLRNNYKLSPDKINFLQNEDATGSNIIRELKLYKSIETPESSRLIIYFSGHGELNEEADVGYWVPYDGVPNDEFSWVSDHQLVTCLQPLECRHVLVITDSCFGARFLMRFRNADLPSSIPFADQELITGRSRFGLASGANLVSDGHAENSPFAKALIEALSKNTGLLSVTSLNENIQEYFRAKKIKQASRCGQISGLKDADFYGQFYFIPNNYAHRESKQDFDEALKEESLTAWYNFIIKHPKSDLLPEAVNRFNRLGQVLLNQALADKDKQALNDFITSYPKSPLRNSAEAYIGQLNRDEQKAEARLHFLNAVSLNNKSALEQYLSIYSTSEDAPEARKILNGIIEAEHVSNLQQITDPEEANLYLSRNRIGYSPENEALIEQHLAKIQFDQALSSDVIKDIEAYLDKTKAILSEGQKKALEGKLSELKEIDLYNKLKGKKKQLSLRGCIDYLKEYPNRGKYFEEIKTSLFTCLEKEMKAEIEYEITRIQEVKTSKRKSSSLGYLLFEMQELEVWTAYVTDKKAGNVALQGNSLIDWIDFYEAHFPDSARLYGFRAKAKAAQFENALQKAKQKNTLSSYEQFWEFDGIETSTIPVTRRKLRSWYAIGGVVLIVLSIFYFRYPFDQETDDVVRLYVEGQYEKAYEQLSKYKDTDNAKALHFLNAAYFAIHGEALDSGRYLFKAQELGYERSHFVLGEMYLRGNRKFGIKPDTAKAIELLNQAIDKKVADAFWLLGGLYANGLKGYIEQDHANAKLYTQLALKYAKYQDDPRVAFEIAEAYSYGRRYFKEDWKEAYQWYRFLAYRGSPEAMLKLGEFWTQKEPLGKDEDKELFWYKQAENVNHKEALNIIANYFKKQNQQDSAMAYYIKAAELGDVSTQLLLARKYKNGDGVKQNTEKSIYWYEQAAKAKSANGFLGLGKLFVEGMDGLEPDYEKAYNYLLKADEENSSPEVYYWLGKLHCSALIDSADFDLGLEYMEKAIKYDFFGNNDDAIAFMADYHFKQKAYRKSLEYYDKLAKSDYNLNDQGLHNIAAIIKKLPNEVTPEVAFKYLGYAVDQGITEADIPFFTAKYNEIVPVVDKQNHKIIYRRVLLTAQQLTALKKYKDSNNDKLLTLLGASYCGEKRKCERKNGDKIIDLINVNISDSMSLSVMDKAAKLGNYFAAFCLGKKHYNNKEYEKATTFLKIVEQKYPDKDALLLEVYLTLGQIGIETSYGLTSDYKEPISYFVKALRIDEKSYSANLALCTIYHQNDIIVQAKKYCKTALTLESPEAREICLERGWIEEPEGSKFWEKVGKVGDAIFN